ncbi:hypothetical protein RhiLY_07628 [Ceratobasidium sp. AG-Ba]|nr:hypothetical protein RhiLY_07628 [Ceratobasidium sp. AG-Ba]
MCRTFSLNFPFVLLNGPTPSQTVPGHLRNGQGLNWAIKLFQQMKRLSQIGPLESIHDRFVLYDWKRGPDRRPRRQVWMLDLVHEAEPVSQRNFHEHYGCHFCQLFARPYLSLYVNGAGVATANAVLNVFLERLVIGAVVLAT